MMNLKSWKKRSGRLGAALMVLVVSGGCGGECGDQTCLEPIVPPGTGVMRVVGTAILVYVVVEAAKSN